MASASAVSRVEDAIASLLSGMAGIMGGQQRNPELLLNSYQELKKVADGAQNDASLHEVRHAPAARPGGRAGRPHGRR